MALASIVVALLLEQWRPLGDRKAWAAGLAAWAGWLESAFNAGEARHGAIAWLVAVLPVVLAVAALHALLLAASPLLALALNVATLYVTLGFRQFSHSFTLIQQALKDDDLERARELLAAWRGEPTLPRGREEVARLAIEEALLASHRRVFGVLLWYLVLPGPSGAVLYRLADFLARRWRHLGAFGSFAARAQRALEWPAVRLTAASFALAGNFEDAVYCWRTQAASWPEPNAGVVLAAGAGAMGVRLGMGVHDIDGMTARPELGTEHAADAGFLDSAVGLLWRALVAWVLVLLLVSAASLL